MSSDTPPSIEQLHGFANQIRQQSPDQLLVEVGEAALGEWQRNIDNVVEALRQAQSAVAANHVVVGNVSALYNSATETATNLNSSGKMIKDNITAALEVAEAVQQIIQSAFSRIRIQSGG